MTKGKAPRSARTAPIPERPSRRSHAQIASTRWAWTEARRSFPPLGAPPGGPPRLPTVPSYMELTLVTLKMAKESSVKSTELMIRGIENNCHVSLTIGRSGLGERDGASARRPLVCDRWSQERTRHRDAVALLADLLPSARLEGPQPLVSHHGRRPSTACLFCR